jgi:membrane protein DedA with SNARE-associated domain
MLVLGVHAREGAVPLWQAVAATWVGTMIGSSLLYFVSRWAGRGLVYRYGRFIRLTPERLDKTEQWLKKHGSRAVFLGRLVPGLRIVTAVACGVFEVPFRIFFPAMSLGALLYILVYAARLLPRTARAQFDEKVHIPFALLGSLVPLALILWWTFRAREALGKRVAGPVVFERHPAGPAAAGLLATIASTLLINVTNQRHGRNRVQLQRTGHPGGTPAAQLAFALARDVQPILLFVAVPALPGGWRSVGRDLWSVF